MANWEAILIDDGSTDKTAKIIKTYCFKDSRFKLIQQNNKGVSVARNLGLEIATGEFIQFLDGDDLLSQSKIEIQAQHLIENHTVDISYVDSYYFAHGNPSQLYPDKEMNGVEWMLKINGRGFDIIKSLVDRNFAVISSPLIRSSILSKSDIFPVGIKKSEDWEFWLNVALNEVSFQYLPNKHAYTLIRIHSSSASFNLRDMQISNLIFRNKIKNYINNSSLSTQEKSKIAIINETQKKGLLKELLYKTPFWKFKNHLEIIKLTQLPVFLKFYLKSINYQRKQWFKS